MKEYFHIMKNMWQPLLSYLTMWIFCSVVEFNSQSLWLKWCKSRLNSALLVLQCNTEFGNTHPSKAGVLSSGKPQELKCDKAVLHRGVGWWTKELLARSWGVLAEPLGLACCPCASGRWDRGQSSTRATKTPTRGWSQPSVLLQPLPGLRKRWAREAIRRLLTLRQMNTFVPLSPGFERIASHWTWNMTYFQGYTSIPNICEDEGFPVPLLHPCLAVNTLEQHCKTSPSALWQKSSLHLFKKAEIWGCCGTWEFQPDPFGQKIKKKKKI